ncbi:hypothetical protein AB0J63_49660 [Streptosporangium canum]
MTDLIGRACPPGQAPPPFAVEAIIRLANGTDPIREEDIDQFLDATS